MHGRLHLARNADLRSFAEDDMAELANTVPVDLSVDPAPSLGSNEPTESTAPLALREFLQRVEEILVAR